MSATGKLQRKRKFLLSFHSSFKEYSPTPLIELTSLAQHLGIKNLFVKDESYRFGLNAFKVLGGSFAIGSYIANELGEDIDDLPYMRLVSDEVRSLLGSRTFITTTDGNHGRGVAWTANRLKQQAIVYMPQGSAAERLSNIRAEGAQAEITDMNYDDIPVSWHRKTAGSLYRIQLGMGIQGYLCGSCRAI